MPIEEKEEKLYMILDDTLDIGKEPLPVFTEIDKAYQKRCKEFLKECYIKKGKSNESVKGKHKGK